LTSCRGKGGEPGWKVGKMWVALHCRRVVTWLRNIQEKGKKLGWDKRTWGAGGGKTLEKTVCHREGEKSGGRKKSRNKKKKESEADGGGEKTLRGTDQSKRKNKGG